MANNFMRNNTLIHALTENRAAQALANRITGALARLRPQRATTQLHTYERAPKNTLAYFDHLREARTRREIIDACNRMYAEDPRPKAIIDRMAEGAVRRGFTLAVTPARRGLTAQAKQAQTRLDALVERLKLKRCAPKHLRRVFRDGDLFLQAVVDKDRQIAGLYRMPVLEMHRHSNDLDLFDDPRFAYWQTASHLAYVTLTPPAMHDRAGVTWFADWQIVHARWDHDEGGRYGTPLLAAVTRAYNRLRDGDKDITMRRRTRAGMRYLHVLEDANDGEIDAYRARNQDALSNPFNAVTDFFSNRRGQVQAIQGDARLSDIDDVVYHLDTLFTITSLPLALIGYGRDLNRDVLTKQYAAYLRALDEVATWYENQVLHPLFETELLLAGIVPDEVVVTVQWAEKDESPFTVSEWQTLATSGRLTDATLLKLLQKIVPDFDAEAELKALEQAEREEMRAVATRDALENALRRRANGDSAEDDDAENAGAEDEQAEAAYAGNGRVHSWRS